jgi:hypothetical protein
MNASREWVVWSATVTLGLVKRSLYILGAFALLYVLLHTQDNVWRVGFPVWAAVASERCLQKMTVLNQQVGTRHLLP